MSASLAFLFVSGCREEKIATYRVPKETVAETPPSAPSATAPDMASTAVPTASGDNLVWTAPAAWEARTASAMRKATYVITGDAGATAELAITAFPGDVGGNLANVNRWRGQLGLPPIDAGALPSALVHVDFNGLHADVVELAGPDGAKRVLGAIVPVGGVTWFFKLTGPAPLVLREKNAFLDFLKTVKTR
ncbi:MAG: hypothetical protein WC661_19630 [Opitutaceae bacterium]